MRAAIALGANLGDRIGTLRSALDEIGTRCPVLAVSSVYETDPVGGPDQPDYLNAVAVVETSMDPRELLAFLQGIEAEHHRTREVRWGARTLDLDILAVDGLVVDEPDLAIPHPRAHERAFVLAPWAEADPAAVIPGHGSVAALRASAGTAGVRLHADAGALTVAS